MSVSSQFNVMGKHLTECTVYPMTVSIASGTGIGTLTPGTGVAFVGLIDTNDLEVQTRTSNVKPTNSTIDNSVILADGFSLNIRALRPLATGVNNAPLLKLLKSNDFFKVVWVQSGLTTTAYGSRGNYSGGHQGEGEQMESLLVNSIDVGSSNFLVTA